MEGGVLVLWGWGLDILRIPLWSEVSVSRIRVFVFTGNPKQTENSTIQKAIEAPDSTSNRVEPHKYGHQNGSYFIAHQTGEDKGGTLSRWLSERCIR